MVQYPQPIHAQRPPCWRPIGERMSTIPIEVSPEQLLRAVERLPTAELAAFADQVIALRAQRTAPHLSRDETALLLQINTALPVDAQARLDALVARREAGAITPADLQELIVITAQIEHQDAARLAALHTLAQLRGTTIPALMADLGITPPTHA
jgi:hypothetical protein